MRVSETVKSQIDRFKNIGFLNHYMLFIVFGLIAVLWFSKGDIVLLLNQNSTNRLDLFFMNYTHLGLGIMFLFVFIAMLFVRFFYAIVSVYNLILNGILTYLFKQVFFHGIPRPTKYFDQSQFYHLINGFDYHSNNSFPSGHTLTAFAIATFLAIVIRNKNWSALLFFYALLVGISRMYLLQHFFIDIYVGSALGLLSTFLAFYVGEITMANNKFMKKNVFDFIKIARKPRPAFKI